MRILLVDDDPQILEALVVSLQLHWKGGEIIAQRDGEAGLKAFFDYRPDIVVLDVNMPAMDGFEVLRAIRNVSDVPVIMLTARVDEVDQVRGLEAGADDYVSKPFGHLALMARIRAVQRRRPSASQTVYGEPDIVAGKLWIDSRNRQVTVGSVSVHLTRLEFDLLAVLAQQKGRLLTYDALVNRLWGSEVFATKSHLKVVASRLRTKMLEATDHDWIKAERNIGYRLWQPVPSDECCARLVD